MPIKIYLPGILRRFAADSATLELEAETVRVAFLQLQETYPEMRGKLLDGAGAPRKFLAVFVNGKNINKTGGPDTKLSDGDEISIVPAAGGG